ncbi:protein-L-isoaspartate(D-aspartate) O-methyltransferase [Achromobacter aloeverae]
MTQPSEARLHMVEHQLIPRGIRHPRVLAAMGKVAREAFLPASLRDDAYKDGPLPIAGGQTISQPYVVALMAQAADPGPGDRVLEIGTGCGYAAAVLAELAGGLDTVERLDELARVAAANLRAQGYLKVAVHHADGSLGWPPGAPYDVIVASASAPDVPAAWREQLAVGGRLVLPAGGRRHGQRLLRITRVDADVFDEEDLGAVSFVPLIGQQGWPASGP